MLRKHHGAVQRGHDVSILSSRESSLEGPRGTRCSPHPLPDATIFSPYHPSSSSSPWSPLRPRSAHPIAQPSSQKRAGRSRKGTTHRASQITPLSKSPDLLASVYTVQRVVTTARSFAARGTTFLFCVLYSYIPLSRRAFRLGTATALSSSPGFCALPVYPFVFFFIVFPGIRILLCLFFLGTRASYFFSLHPLFYARYISSRFSLSDESCLFLPFSVLIFVCDIFYYIFLRLSWLFLFLS